MGSLTEEQIRLTIYGVVIVALAIFAKYMEFRQSKKQVKPRKRHKVGYQLRKKINLPSN
jgi:uncharacterized membrane protein